MRGGAYTTNSRLWLRCCVALLWYKCPEPRSSRQGETVRADSIVRTRGKKIRGTSRTICLEGGERRCYKLETEKEDRNTFFAVTLNTHSSTCA